MARRSKAVRSAFIGRLLTGRNPWVLLAAGVVFAVRLIRQRAAEGKSIGILARLPGMTPAQSIGSNPDGGERGSRVRAYGTP